MRARYAVAAFWAVLGAAAAAYFQGLGGAFLVDDYPNLEGLAAIPSEGFWDGVLRYATGGFSSPLGRPLSLLSFGLQAHSWPGHPEDFIYVNILLHLLNACLLLGAWSRLLALLPRPPGAAAPWIALAAVAFWLLAAPQAGAVLYVIQRMALLAGTFVLLGLWLYLAGRGRELAGRRRSGFALMLAGLGCAVPVGFLAKETAALFPLLLLMLEVTLLRELPRSRAFRAFAAACLWLPSLALAGYLLQMAPRVSPADNMKDFTLAERLLTEPRVLFMYLEKALFPSLYGLRLYYDDLPLSRSLLQPWTTAAALAAWAALLGGALALRRRAPMFAFAVLWFLAAHLLEGTVIPLELAFDHRNYVALAGVGLALAWYGARLLQSPRLRRVRPALVLVAAGYGGFLLVACWQTAAFWGRPWELAHYWAQQQPESKRAQQAVGKVYWHFGQPALAMAAHERSLQRWPGDVSFFLAMLELGCAFPGTAIPDLGRLPGIVSRYEATIPSTIGTLDILVTTTEDGRCDRYTPAQLWAITAMTFDTPRLASQAQNRLLLQSRIAELARDRASARALLDEAIGTGPPPSAVMLHRATDWSLQAGDLQCAAHYLNRFDRGELKRGQAVSYRDEFARLRSRRDRIAADPAYRPRPADLPACQNEPMGSKA